MAAFMQFDSSGMALLVAGASLAITTAIGTFVTTWMTGRITQGNSAAATHRPFRGPLRLVEGQAMPLVRQRTDADAESRQHANSGAWRPA
jgi:hypothetical protein